MKVCHIEDLDKITEITSKVTNIIKFQTRKPLEAVAIFDLAGSTNMKLKIGHDETIKKIFLHNQICGQITKRFKGRVVKNIGDHLKVLLAL
jgi:class 3 adenylate cyclase